MNRILSSSIWMLVWITLLAGCQSQLMLMPTPEVLKDPDFNLFLINPEPMTSNTINTFFVSPRRPADAGDEKHFLGRADEQLHFGRAETMIGPENLDVVQLIRESTVGIAEQKYAWSLLAAPLLGSTVRPAGGESATELPGELAPFMSALNTAIAANPIKELTIYVHGANNTFYWSVAQGAQFQYFTGDNALVLTFAWPSPGNIFSYGADKRQANASATDLAWLLELLARHSDATRINLIAYSAGGRVVGRALTELGQRHQSQQALRIGHVYLTQSDQPLVEFIDALPGFFDLLEGLTITSAVGDPVLQMAQMTDQQIRLGATGEGDDTELDLDEATRNRIISILNDDRTAYVNLREVSNEHFKFTHGAWYDDPWVSTDVMAALLAGLPAGDRGLVFREVDGLQIWSFPEDYLDRLKTFLLSRPDSERAAPTP